MDTRLNLRDKEKGRYSKAPLTLFRQTWVAVFMVDMFRIIVGYRLYHTVNTNVLDNRPLMISGL